jgi:hypothetical protein
MTASKSVCASVVAGVLCGVLYDVLGGALCGPAFAAEPVFPAPLLGKSVTLAWTVNRQQRFDGSEAIVSRKLDITLQIYVSTAGRPFSKEQISVSGVGGALGGTRPIKGDLKTTQAPGDRGDPERANIVHFEGGALVADRQLAEGARRISITFDADYRSCKAEVIIGREAGAGPIRMKGISGRYFEVVSSMGTVPACAVTAGNVFGSESGETGK